MARRILPLLPPLLLVAVAVHQIALTRVHGLNPWKGGGFGMFATLDHGSARHVRIVGEVDGRDVAWRIPAEFETARLDARQLPRPGNLRRLADAAQRGWPDDEPAPEAIRVEVWRATVDLDGGGERRELLRSLRVSGPAP